MQVEKHVYLIIPLFAILIASLRFVLDIKKQRLLPSCVNVIQCDIIVIKEIQGSYA